MDTEATQTGNDVDGGELVIPTDVDADVSEDEYAAILRADLEGNEAATAFLEQDVEEWCQGLVNLIQHVEAQFSKRKAEASEFQTRCKQQPDDGRQEWFEYQVDYDRWRSSAGHFRRRVVTRLQQVKVMRAEQNDTRYEGGNGKLTVMLQEILDRLQRIEQKLGAS